MTCRHSPTSGEWLSAAHTQCLGIPGNELARAVFGGRVRHRVLVNARPFMQLWMADVATIWPEHMSENVRSEMEIGQSAHPNARARATAEAGS